MNIFKLPPELLTTLVPRTLITEPLPPEPTVPRETLIHKTGAKGLACTACLNAVFEDANDQRSHYRSDWHRYNVKARMAGKKVVSETEFSNIVNNLSDSLSGSESSDSDDEKSDKDAVTAAFKKARKLESSRPVTPDAISIPRSPIQWFHSPPSTQIGIYKAIFPLDMEQRDYLNELTLLQDGGDEGRLWTMFMIAGGHFAAIVVRVCRPRVEELLPQKGGAKQRPELEIINHKTFHRYTTRRKQGGSQSVNDNAKGNAKSAGATLRRYGEQALKDDIRGLMSEWAEDIRKSELIWIRANVSNKRILYDYDDAVFAKNDARLRSFPFPTRRPTQAELIRCLGELIRPKVSHLTEDELRAQDEELKASIEKAKVVPIRPAAKDPPKQKESQPQLTKEQEALKEKWKRVLEMVRKGRTEPLKIYWERESQGLGGVDARIPEWADTEVSGLTLLHVAASSAQDSIVQWLLEELDANPTIGSDSTESQGSGKTAYDISESKAVRDTFRRIANERQERWDWIGKAHLPSFLSKEMEDDQINKKKTRRKGLKEKMKEREEREQTIEPEESADDTPTPPGALSGPQKLGGGAASGSLAGLTPEMRNKLERERRARAIEARMGKP